MKKLLLLLLACVGCTNATGQPQKTEPGSQPNLAPAATAGTSESPTTSSLDPEDEILLDAFLNDDRELASQIEGWLRSEAFEPLDAEDPEAFEALSDSDHGNSKDSTRPQHMYVIVMIDKKKKEAWEERWKKGEASSKDDKYLTFYKVGVSGKGVRQSDGKSIRAEEQVRDKNRESLNSKQDHVFVSRIVDKADIRAKILGMENEFVWKHKQSPNRGGRKPPGNIRPDPQSPPKPPVMPPPKPPVKPPPKSPVKPPMIPQNR